MTFPFAARALNSRNFRLFFGGQIVSLVGSWGSTTANAWVIYHLSGDVVKLGFNAFAAQFPAFLLAPFAGVLVDRWDLRRTIVGTQTLAMLQSAALATLCWNGWATVGSILALQLFQGLVNAFDLPSRQSFGIQMVDRREDLPNAIALNSTMLNLARFVGPALAGAIIAVSGGDAAGPRAAAWVYTLDAVSYVGVIAALLAMRLRPHVARVRTTRFAAEFVDGLRYVAGYPALRTALLLLCATSFFGVSYQSQIAALAKSTFGLDAAGYGRLIAAVGLGATASALFLATRRTTAGLPRYIGRAAAVFAIALYALSRTQSAVVAYALGPILGASMVLQAAGTNTLLQTLAVDDKRGRVMSFFTMAFMGTVPLGAVTLGAAASRLGLQDAIGVGAVACLAAALLARSELHRVAAEMQGPLACVIARVPVVVTTAGDDPAPAESPAQVTQP